MCEHTRHGQGRGKQSNQCPYDVIMNGGNPHTQRVQTLPWEPPDYGSPVSTSINYECSRKWHPGVHQPKAILLPVGSGFPKGMEKGTFEYSCTCGAIFDVCVTEFCLGSLLRMSVQCSTLPTLPQVWKRVSFPDHPITAILHWSPNRVLLFQDRPVTSSGCYHM